MIVRLIFDLYVNHGYGTHRIATKFINEGIRARSGKNWHHCSIRNMIRNITYTGVLRSGNSRSEAIDELQIIPPHVYEKAQDIMDKRRAEGEERRTYPMNTESRCLLNGKVYCADCGYRLHVATGKFIKSDPVKQRSLRYMCYGKTRKRTDCKGQNSYLAKRVDEMVDGVIREVFRKLRSIPKDEVVNSRLTALQSELQSRYITAQRDFTKSTTELAELKAEVIKAIRGESKFTPELLSELIAVTEKQVAEIVAVRDSAKRELDDCKYRVDEMQAKYDEVISWTELYDTADFTAKKMIIANIVNRIDVSTNYEISIDLNLELSYYNIQLDCCTYGKTA